MTRRELRENIFRILFKVEFNDIEEMDEQMDYTLFEIEDINPKDEKYITDKVRSIINVLSELDSIIEEISDGWRIDRIGKAELAILRLAIYEIKYDDDIPFKVSVNEAVELAKKYCNPDAGGFVNGLLAKVSE